MTDREPASAAGAVPKSRVEPRPLALEALKSRRRGVEQREPSDVDAAVTKIVQLQFVHRLHGTHTQLSLPPTLAPTNRRKDADCLPGKHVTPNF